MYEMGNFASASKDNAYLIVTNIAMIVGIELVAFTVWLFLRGSVSCRSNIETALL